MKELNYNYSETINRYYYIHKSNLLRRKSKVFFNFLAVKLSLKRHSL